LPQAMLNFLALLGWSPGDDVEIMTVPQMIERFTADALSKKAAVFDMKKLEWMNGQHLSAMPAAELAARITPALVAAGLAAERASWYFGLLDLLKVRARTTDDIVRQAMPYFGSVIGYDPAATAKVWKDADATVELLRATRDSLAAVREWSPAALEESLRALASARGIGAGALFQPLRVALTGMTASPGIFEVLELLGRERALERIDMAVRYIGETTARA